MSKNNSVQKAPEITATREDGKEDPDWMYKPILRGVINTRPGDDSGNWDGWSEGVY